MPTRRPSALAALVVGAALVALVILPELLAQPAKPGRKVALLVGVQDYTGTGLSNLKYCENDVAELAAVLKGQGYKDDDLIVMTSSAAFEKKKENLFPTAGNVRDWLKGLVEDLQPEDTVLVAFSGHGVHLKQLKEKGLFFCPKGADLNKPETLVSLAEVYDQFEKHCRAGVKVLVVDACRNDPTDGRAGGDGRLDSITRPLVPEPPGGLVAFFSCSTGQVAYESDTLKHGIFFHHFIQGLKGGPADDPIGREGEVTVPLLEDYLTRAVPVAVKKDKGNPTFRQTPERKGSLRGQVVLARVGAVGGGGAPGSGNSGGGSPSDLAGSSEPKPGEERAVEIADGVKMVFCWVPAGKATLGSPASEKDRYDNETEHEFTTKGFWLGKYEVTQAEWTAVMGENPSEFDGKKDNKAKGLDTSRFPVERVSWDDCQAFFKKVNARAGVGKALGKAVTFQLPHEDEWEYACRGGTGNRQPFYFGTELNGRQANCDGNYPYGTTGTGPYLERTAVVGSYAKESPHPWGLADMHGNVWEWCENLYSTGPSRVYRGGSWSNFPRSCRSASRNWGTPGFRLSSLGFRAAGLVGR